MPHSETILSKSAPRAVSSKPKSKRRKALESRYTVGLPTDAAQQVKQYAKTVDVSVSKAIALLVRRGSESQENRKREFFRTLKENLASDDPKQEDRLIDEFRSLILGR